MSNFEIRKPAERKRACADRTALKMALSTLVRQHKESGSPRLLRQIQAIELELQELSNAISHYDRSVNFLDADNPSSQSVMAFLRAVPRNLLQLRKQKQWSLEHLAELTGMTKQLLSKYELEEFQHTTLERLIRIIEALAND